jgi:hypothetical protein
MVSFASRPVAWAAIVSALCLWSCESGPTGPSADQNLILQAYCEVIPQEDADNNGIRADGKPWDLSDVALDTGVHFVTGVPILLGENSPDRSELSAPASDLPRFGVMLRDALATQDQAWTVRQMCSSVGRPSNSTNSSVERSISEAETAIGKGIRLP